MSSSSLALISFLFLFTKHSLCFYPRFEYLYSFSNPRILATGKDKIQFFTHEGDVILDDHLIRLNPSLQNHKGLIYTNKISNFDSWEVVLDLKAFGANRVGGEGMAFWYTQSQPKLGPVYGSNDKWNGLSIIFDSFDNDRKGPNPQIILVMNDGSSSYNHALDGAGQIIAGCQVDYRNTQFPFRIHIRYADNKISLWYNSGVVNLPHPSLEPPLVDTNKGLSKYGLLCFKTEHLNLPKTGYFGISGMSGQIGDDHDIYSFLVYSIHAGQPPKYETNQDNIKDKEEYDKDIESYRKKKRIDPYEDIENLGEDVYARSLHAIHLMQNDILNRLNDLDSKYPVALLRSQINEIMKELNNIKKLNSLSNAEMVNSNHPMSLINKQLGHLQYNMDLLVHDHKHGLATCIEPSTLLIVVTIQLVIGIVLVILFKRREAYNRKIF